ncbi:MAG: fasciclin domain-containing protein [Oligoflexus sp.]
MRHLTPHKLMTMFLAMLMWTACGSDSNDDSKSTPSPAAESSTDVDKESELNLVQVISTNDRFSLLSQALNESGLIETLGDSDITFFAPTNAAFEALPQEEREQLFADHAKLQELVRNHLVAGRLSIQDLIAAEKLVSLNELPLKVRVDENEDVFINNTRVNPKQLPATNGIVYEVDSLLTAKQAPELPGEESGMGIYEIIAANEELSIFAELAKIGGVEKALNVNGPFTIFVPTNAAFRNIDEQRLEYFRSDEDAAATIIELHTVANRYLLEDIDLDSELSTLSGVSVSTSHDGDSLVVGEAKITKANMPAKNGIIHIVDRVFLHPTNE